MGGIEPMGKISLLTFLFIGLPEWRQFARNRHLDRGEQVTISTGMSQDPLQTHEAEAIRQLNSIRYVNLREISEPNKRVFNAVRIVVEEAIVNEAAVAVSDRPELAGVLAGAYPIESVEGCKTFSLSWKHYLAYLVTEELVASNAPNGYADEVYTGKILRVYTKSHFLDHVMRDTGGHIQEVLHYKLICLNHLIDVVSYYPPEVKVLAGGEGLPNRETWLQ
jgi:hypothetical protein